MNQGSLVLSSISSSNSMGAIHMFLYDVFDEMFSQFLLFEVNYSVLNISFGKPVNFH